MDRSENDVYVTNSDNVAAESKVPRPSGLPQEDSRSGIDVKQALDILSSRIPNDYTQKPPPSACKEMGQIIDMFAPSSDSPRPPSKPTTRDKMTNSTSSAKSVSPEEQRRKIRDTLKGLPFVALLKTVLTAQEDRVRTYRLYDDALGKVLVTNRLTDYPPACVAATAAFAVLSNTVAAVRDELSGRAESRKDLSTATSVSSSVIKSIGDLQELERQKLQLTAAYHLEQIRANNLKQSNSGNVEEEDIDVDTSELSLLNNGIANFRSQIETCRSEINFIIDDLRCALVELIETEEEQEEA